MPLVSVIVPVFNALPYLREALDSVVHQTYRNLEILIVDDGSTDGSGEVCDEYRKDPRVQVLHQANQGPSVARNAGLDRMSGDVVAFLDSDDALYPDMVQTMLAVMERNAADIVIGGYAQFHVAERMDANLPSKLVGYQEERLTSRDAIGALVEGRISHYPWNKLYAREVWQGIRFPEERRAYEDIFTIYRVFRQARSLMTMPGKQVMRRIRAGSLTHVNSVKHIRDRMEAYEELEQFLKDNIPRLFNEKQFLCLFKRDMSSCISNWGHLPLDKQAEAADIRKRMVQKAKENGIVFLPIRSIIAFEIIHFCPFLLPCSCFAYRGFKKLVSLSLLPFASLRQNISKESRGF